ncbi:hypothetical protein [Maritalea porphyrae]|uniref:hypothetical protein n=1 Tax=Maritalea porphyrae TaxID=880732 RepID=UPI0022B06D89|nr:hypothetical protein [Maritalea porphyrae]MCZ4274090.1 hypothetical protein [Maritalea porphyrae]
MQNTQTNIRPMSQSEYAIWLPHCTKEFAKEKAQAMAISQDEALKLSEQSFKSILPEGLNTPRQLPVPHSEWR